MSYHFLPNIIFLVCAAAVILMFLRHLPEAEKTAEGQTEKKVSAEEKLEREKGLPTVTQTKLFAWTKFWTKKIWNFALEAKDIKPSEATGYRIRKLFQHRTKQQTQKPSVAPVKQEPPQQTPIEQNEEDLLKKIKAEPKNLENYQKLGQFYMNKKSYTDAKDIYSYLCKHDPANAEYQAKLANCHYRLGDFTNAISQFEKSLSLDSTQPNRYYNLGLAYTAVKKFKESTEAFRHSTELDSQNGKYFFALGNAYEIVGDKDKALKAFREAKKIDPDNREIFEKLKNLI